MKLIELENCMIEAKKAAAMAWVILGAVQSDDWADDDLEYSMWALCDILRANKKEMQRMFDEYKKEERSSMR